MKSWLATVMLSSGIVAAHAASTTGYLVPLTYEDVPEHVTITFSGYRDNVGTVEETVKGPKAGGVLTDAKAVNEDGWDISVETEEGFLTPTFWVCPVVDGKPEKSQAFACSNGWTRAKWSMSGVYVYDIAVERIPATVYFNLNGGTCPELSSPRTVAFGAAYGELPVPTRKDYTFAGWWIAGTETRVVSTTIERSWGYQTLEARWTGNSHWVMFDANGGAGSAAPGRQTKGGALTVQMPSSAAFTREGYSLAGWSTRKGASVAYAAGGTCEVWLAPPEGADYVTLYAVWNELPDDNPATHDVRFEGQGSVWTNSTPFGGTPVATNKMPWCAMPESIVRMGADYKDWAFRGWNMNLDGLLVPVDVKAGTVPDYLPLGDLTLAPILENVRKTELANALDASGREFDVWTKSGFTSDFAVMYDADATSATCLAASTMTNNAGLGSSTLFTVVKGSGTLTFRWRVVSDGADPTATWGAADRISVFTDYVRTDNNTEYVCSVAAGANAWGRWDKLGGAGVVASGPMPWTDAKVEITAAPEEETTVTWEFWKAYAKHVATAYIDEVVWTPASDPKPDYTVTFDANGGAGTMAAAGAFAGAASALPANAFTKEGCAFQGWSVHAEGAIVLADKAAAQFCKDTTLYAQWAPAGYEVAFDANGGSGKMPACGLVSGQTGYLTPVGFVRPGYDFQGWATSATGEAMYLDAGKAPPAATTLYAVWEEHVYQPGESFFMTFHAEGWTDAYEVVAGQTLDAAVPEAPAVPGKTFKGWFPGADGKGAAITSDTLATSTLKDAYAAYETAVNPPKPPPSPDFNGSLYGKVEPAQPGVAAAYQGRIVDRDGRLRGTVQVKVAKYSEGKGFAKVTATVLLTGEKKRSYKGGEWRADAKDCSLVCGTDARTLKLVLGEAGLSGTLGPDLFVDGALDFFTAKDASAKAEGDAVLGRLGGCYTLAYPEEEGWTVMSVTVGAKGKAKVQGTLASGTKVSCSGKLLVGEAACCVPVAFAKNGEEAVVELWIGRDGSFVSAEGPEGVVADVAGRELASGAVFTFDAKAVAALVGGEVVMADLPDGIGVKMAAGKWVVAGGAKAGGPENPSALKLTFSQKTCLFKGKFKVWVKMGDKKKAVSVTVAGAQVGSAGYGSIRLKKLGGVPAEIAPAPAH